MNATDAPVPQGSLELLDTPTARELLASDLYARVAYTARDGTPRIVPTWFQWVDGALVMPTYVKAPHVPQPAHRLAALRARPEVAVSIDTEERPPRVLQIRGRAEITEVDGVDPDYAVSARQYLGEEGGNQLVTMSDQPGTRMARIVVRPTWVGLIDFQTRLPGVMAT
jgi:pyridoxamine 5'-phosphate oxidase-like protein